MEVTPVHSVILAQDYKKLVEWYKKTLGLKVKLEVSDEFHYTDLASQDGQLVVGICPASEMGHEPTEPRNNSLCLHISTSDIEALFKQVKKAKGKDLFGPSVDKKEGYKYGAFSDPEGNSIWVIENFHDLKMNQ